MSHDNHHAKTLPSNLDAPDFVTTWRNRALGIAIVAGLLSVFFLITDREHFLAAYTVGFMMCFSFACGGTALLMLQYVSGGKWGLLLRRPLEAMSGTLWLVALMFIPIGIGMKQLYLWARPDAIEGLKNGTIASFNAAAEIHAIEFKRGMLNPAGFWIRAIIYFAVLMIFSWLLSSWSRERDADKGLNYDKWRTRLENLSGPGILVYSVVLTGAAIDWVMSMDPAWYSTVWGLRYLVGQGYVVLALGILTVIMLSKAEPMKTILRTTEQLDLGKLAFAFVMLNIYLAFAEYLIIWSGNQPEEINWFLDRFRGGWGIIITLDFIFHWVIPFTLLLSRDLKRNKRKLAWVCIWMIFARAFDFFWQIAPTFSKRNLQFSVGMLAYITVPVGLIALWTAAYCIQLKSRPLVAVNDAELEGILEPEHAH
jgi:hypothetical protein